MKWLKFAALNVLRNRRRSLMAAFIAALGSAALLLAAGFAAATYDALAQATARDSGHLVVATPEQLAQEEEDTPLQHGLDDAAALRQRLLRADAAVRHVLPRLDFGGLAAHGGKSVAMVGLGLDLAAERAARGDFVILTDGALPEDGHLRARVLLGRELARSLRARPGDRLTLMATGTDGRLATVAVQVQAVFTTGMPERDRRLLVTDLSTAQQLLGSARVGALAVYLDDLDAVEATLPRLAAALPPGVTVRGWLAQAGFYRSVQALYDRIFGTLGLVIGVIVALVVAGAMAAAIAERTREIGALRALGTLPGQLLRALALEGLLLGGAGAACGAALALGVAALLRVFPVQMPPPPGLTLGYPLRIDIAPPLALATVALVALLSMLATAWVARRAVRRPIVEALGHV